jgi:5-methylcytosine-specific restriction endonuclease McrA
MPQEFAEPTHEIDHIVAEKHLGPTTLENLALACFPCNNHKGPNVAGADPVTAQVTRLFHPRQDAWPVHFE